MRRHQRRSNLYGSPQSHQLETIKTIAKQLSSLTRALRFQPLSSTITMMIQMRKRIVRRIRDTNTVKRKMM